MTDRDPMTQQEQQEAEAYGDAWSCLNTLRAYLSPELAAQCQQQLDRSFDVKSACPAEQHQHRAAIEVGSCPF